MKCDGGWSNGTARQGESVAVMTRLRPGLEASDSVTWMTPSAESGFMGSPLRAKTVSMALFCGSTSKSTSVAAFSSGRRVTVCVGRGRV